MSIKKYHRVTLKMKKLINPIILAGFIYTIAVHVIRFHWRSIALFLVPLLVGVGIISILNWIISPTIEEIASLIRESEKKHEEAGDGIEIANDCAHLTELNAICVDRAQRRIYVGTGTGFVVIDDLPEGWREARIKDNGIYVDCGEELNLPFQMGRTFAHEEYQPVVKIALTTEDDGSYILDKINGCKVDGTELHLSVFNMRDYVLVVHGDGLIELDGNKDISLAGGANEVLVLIRVNGVWTNRHRADEETSATDDVLQKAHEIAEIGDTILLNEGFGSDARLNSVRVLHPNGNGFLVYTSDNGPVMECVKDYGTEHERPCEEDSTEDNYQPNMNRDILYGGK